MSRLITLTLASVITLSVANSALAGGFQIKVGGSKGGTSIRIGTSNFHGNSNGHCHKPSHCHDPYYGGVVIVQPLHSIIIARTERDASNDTGAESSIRSRRSCCAMALPIGIVEL